MSKGRRGGQPGNQNARTHGLYSKALDAAERVDLSRALRADPENLDEEIALLRVKTARLADATRRTARGVDPPAQYETLLTGLRTLAHLVAVRHRLSPQAKAELADAIAGVVTGIGTQLGVYDAPPERL